MATISADSTRAIRLITRREVSSRLFSKPFLAGALASVALIFGVFGLGSIFGGGDDELRLGLLGSQPTGAVELLDLGADRTDTRVEIIEFSSAADADAALETDEIDGLVVDGTELRMTETDNDLVALVAPAWQQAALVGGLNDSGLSDGEIDTAFASAELALVELNADPDRDNREAVAFFSVILLFIAIQLASAYILMGVFEEKTTKVVELVLSAVRARHLLLGKIIGVGVLGLVQVLVLAGSAVTAAAIFGSDALPSLTAGLVLSGVVWFVLGYLLYGSVFAAGASLAPRQEDAQSTLGPVSVALMLSYFGAIFAASNPESTLASVVSWIPLTAPFAMPGRIASSAAAWWEVVGSMALTAVAAMLLLRLAERIYVRSVIHTDRKLGWREAWALES